MAASDGGVFAYGDAAFYGSAGGLHLKAPVVGLSPTPGGGGYWLAAIDGGVFAYGDAGFYGSAGSLHLNAPVVGMAATLDGNGYWLVAADGGVFAYGDAAFYGSAGSLHLNAPVVGIAATPDGDGYWLVAADGGIFAYGDAAFDGSAGSLHLNAPVVGVAATSDGEGYWLVAADGGMFAYGDADFYGSALNGAQAVRVVGMAATSDGEGCWLVTPAGEVLTYGNAGYFGGLAAPIALYGDSLGMQAAPYFNYLAGASRASVLLRAYYGWAICDDLTAMANDVATRHPAVAVIQFSGNAMTQCMSGYRMRTTAYYDKYQADAQAAISIFRNARIPVILIGSPISAGADLSANIDHVNQIYETLAAVNPGVTYVDAGQAVLDHGHFTWTCPASPSNPVPVRPGLISCERLTACTSVRMATPRGKGHTTYATSMRPVLSGSPWPCWAPRSPSDAQAGVSAIRARSSGLTTLPVGFRGRASTKMNWRGTL